MICKTTQVNSIRISSLLSCFLMLILFLSPSAIHAQDPGRPTGLDYTDDASKPNEFILTWNANALATGGFNIGIVGADDMDIWIAGGYKAGTSYTFKGTYGAGTSSEITIEDGKTYTVKLQALPDANYDNYSDLPVTVNAAAVEEPGNPTGLAVSYNAPNELTLTWDADPLATDGFNVAIVGADDKDVWVEWGYKAGTSYTFKGTYGVGTSSEITIADGEDYVLKLQAQPDADGSAYSEIDTSKLSTNDVEGISFNVSPNPVSETVNIQANTKTINDISKVSIYALSGQLLKESHALKIKVGDLRPGLYILSVEDRNGNITTKKFVKK